MIRVSSRKPKRIPAAFLDFTMPLGDWDILVYDFQPTSNIGLAASRIAIAALMVLCLQSHMVSASIATST